MADRNVYGRDFSENGWRMVDQGSCVWVRVPGTDSRVSLQIREGQPAAILAAFAADWNAYIEPLRDADSACWTATNSVASSNHLSGTAMDLNWGSHPFRVADAGFSSSQLATMREMLAFYEGTVFWGNDWNSPKDAMHAQCGYDTYGAQNVARVQSFIDRKIRADGYSTFRRGGVPRGGGTATQPSAPANPIPTTSGLTGEVLWRIAGRPTRVTVARYAELLPRLVECLRACDCTTIDRRAMWFAQVFHESGGLFYTEEIASGDAYDTRTDLGNTPQVDGDGRLYKGRSFIQVTGKNNYAALSGWAFDRGLVPTRDWFVVHPDTLDDDQYAFLGVTWYWTTQRPMNVAADARNLELATRYVNGGQNGIDYRRAIYNRALAENANLLDSTPADPWEELMALSVPSLSIYANPGEPDVPVPTMIAALDAHGPHEPYVEKQARLGDVDSIRRVARTANGQGNARTARTPAAIKQATDVFASIDPALIRAAIPTA